MENTIENKVKFIAQYWGQNIFIDPKNTYTSICWGIFQYERVFNGSAFEDFKYEYPHLDEGLIELVPLSKISEKDAIEVAKIFNIGHRTGTTAVLIKYILSALNGTTSKSETTEFVLSWKHATEYLRFRGYALPWMGVSVENQIEYGWVKLKKYEIV